MNIVIALIVVITNQIFIACNVVLPLSLSCLSTANSKTLHAYCNFSINIQQQQKLSNLNKC